MEESRGRRRRSRRKTRKSEGRRAGRGRRWEGEGRREEATVTCSDVAFNLLQWGEK